MIYDAASLVGRLPTLPDPRRRQGRRYPLPALRGLLVLAALHGEPSLRGMWLWSRQPGDAVWGPRGLGSPHVPALTTSWNLLGALDAAMGDQIVGDWLREVLGRPVGGVSADGKVLRESRRIALPAVWVVALARHDVGSVVRQRQLAMGSHELPTLLALRGATWVHDQTRTLDAGLVCADPTHVIGARQGNSRGVVKGTPAEIKTSIDDWVSEQVLSRAVSCTGCPHRGEGAGAHRNP